ncbi:MAG: TolC family protein, partial [Paramuribaculum sp.]|nr:TolC family protein [Paramuribaculum sp.]
MKRFIVVPLMAGVVLSALAEGEKWSLDSCINYAINHNISVRNSKNDRYSAELGVTEAKDAFLPQANAQAGQSFNFGRGLTSENTYANRNTTQTGWNVGVSVPL